MFKRVLMVWLKDEARADAPALESAYRALPGKVNGLLSVTAGPPAEGEYDLVIEMRFRDSMAMRLCEASADYKALYARLEAAAARLEASAFGEDDRGDGVLESQRAEAYPMKWHKFLIYFALWAGAVLNLISGVQMFSVGLNAGGMLWIGYEMSSGLRALYIVSGVLLIAIGMFQIFTRSALARFSRRGPRMVVWLYASLVILNALEILLAWLLFGVPLNYLLTVDIWFYLIEGVLMTWANQVYYRKRAALFVND